MLAIISVWLLHGRADGEGSSANVVGGSGVGAGASSVEAVSRISFSQR
jgi:hypothetical protein